MIDYGKIAVGLRTNGNIDPAFFQSWTNLMLSGLGPDDVVLSPSVGRPHSLAVGYLTYQFLKTDCDSLLFIDDDAVFDVDALAKLRETNCEADIFGAVVPARRAPFCPIVLVKNPEHGDGKPRFLGMRKLAGVVYCDTLGFAFTLITRRLLDHVVKNRGFVCEFRNNLGEDGDLCLWAHEHNYKIAVNADICLGHRSTFTVRWNAPADSPELHFESFGMMDSTISGLAPHNKEK